MMRGHGTISEGYEADLSGLAELARNQQLDVRPVILRVQTDLFLAAPAHDRRSIRQFEALACGMIPLVDEETAAIVARKLGASPLTPPVVIEALEARGGIVAESLLAARLEQAPKPDEVNSFERIVAQLLMLHDEDVDAALAAHDPVIAHREARELILQEAARRPALARNLLARADLALAEQVPLYLFAPPLIKAELREKLTASALVSAHKPPLRADETLVRALVRFASERDLEGFESVIETALDLPAPTHLTQEGREDALALALAALDIPSDIAIAIFLTLDERIASSISIVFELAETVRTIPRLTASYLVSLLLRGSETLSRQGEHQPYLDPSSTPQRGAIAKPEKREVFIPERFRNKA